MKPWKYIDYSKPGEYSYHGKLYKNGIQIFMIECESILDADKAFEKAIGKSPIKLMHVGCFQEEV